MTQGVLFEGLPEARRVELTFSQIRRPVWTENKAKLIERYLYYFVLITHHGAFIDGFSAPQSPQDQKQQENWAAKLVLNSEPKLLRDIWLCDLSSRGAQALRDLAAAQPAVKGRRIEVIEGDFNRVIDEILASGRIKEKTATFCVLDQRTFECEWSTVEKLARHKTGNKIELFYFLATGWFERAVSATTRSHDKIERWWGRADWQSLGRMSGIDRALYVCERLRNELGYRYAYPWPIYEQHGGGKVMYHMIHCSDHAEAPKLMYRAYRKATEPQEDDRIIQDDFERIWGAQGFQQPASA